MKEFLRIFEKDYMEENFSRKEWLLYGILTPVALVVVMALAGWLESLV